MKCFIKEFFKVLGFFIIIISLGLAVVMTGIYIGSTLGMSQNYVTIFSMVFSFIIAAAFIAWIECNY